VNATLSEAAEPVVPRLRTARAWHRIWIRFFGERRSYRESAAEGRDRMSKKHFEWAARELAAAHLAGTFDARETHAIKTFCATMFLPLQPALRLGSIREPRGQAHCRRAAEGACGMTRARCITLGCNRVARRDGNGCCRKCNGARRESILREARIIVERGACPDCGTRLEAARCKTAFSLTFRGCLVQSASRAGAAKLDWSRTM